MADLTEARFAAKSVEYETPQDLFDGLDAEFGFTCDVASTDANAKCAKHFTLADDGLAQPWEGVCWCNPPYGREMPRWIRKARSEAETGNATTVLLIPARTNTGWWHDECMNGEVRFIRGRPRFNGGKHGLPFPLAFVIFRTSNAQHDAGGRSGANDD